MKSKQADSKKAKLPARSAQSVTATGVLGLMPLITEKAVAGSGKTQTIVFRVRPQATKGQISQAVQQRFSVLPISVRTMQMTPKRRNRGQTVGSTNSWKKAYVTLPAGKTIDFSV